LEAAGELPDLFCNEAQSFPKERETTTPMKTIPPLNIRLVLAALLCGISAALALVGLSSFSTLHAEEKTDSQRMPHGEKLSPADADGRFVYLIEFGEPGALHRASRASGESFRPEAPETKVQLGEIAAEQATHLQALAHALDRPLAATHRYLVTHSGVAARLTAAEAEIVRGTPGVASIERERVHRLQTYAGPTLIGAPTIWNGSAVPTGIASRGQGMIVALLDSGIDPAHPSFANDANCGHGQGGMPNKIVSNLDCSSATGPGGLCNGTDPEDTIGHGTWMSSVIAGNPLGPNTQPPPAPPAPHTAISGVAPCASIRSYKVCSSFESCPASTIQAGINSILLHGDADVTNYSISGGSSPWIGNERRKLDLVDAGIVVATASGNIGASNPNAIGEVNHLGPWMLTAAGSTHGGHGAGRLSLAGPGTPPPSIANIHLLKGSAAPVGSPLTNYPIRRFPGHSANAEGCTAFPAGYFNGSVALIRRGTCPFFQKIQNAYDAGATLVLIRNNSVFDVYMRTEDQPNVPAYSMDMQVGDPLAAYVDANPNTATVSFAPIAGADVLASISLRGPSALMELTKPDVAAPAVQIYTADPLFFGGYFYSSGTSHASAFTSGAAALVRAVQPAWSAPEVKSALMMTAFNGGTKEDTVTPWNADDVGNGRIDLTKAARAGLVMHETTARFLSANPASGGDPKTLNLASMRNMQCTPNCTWTRTVRNTRNVPSTWSASGVATTPGFHISVTPANFSFTGNPSETRQLTITATPSSNLSAAVAFGQVVLSNGGESPDQHLTVAIKGQPLTTAVVSRKSHGDAGSFNVNLPLTGTAGVEPRAGGPTNDYELVVTFGDIVSVNGSPQAAVTFGTATIGSGGVSNGGAVAVSGSTVTVPLTNVANAQTINVTLASVSTSAGSGNIVIPMSILIGDTNADRSVNSGDAIQTRGRSGQSTEAGNFRSDVNADGAINGGDAVIVRSRSGTNLP
jgi:hypothetical protein